MAKLDKMPQQSIIDGYKGILDFYYWKGIPVVRKWPRHPPRVPSAAEKANQDAFAYINRLWSTLPANIIAFYNERAAGTSLTGKDFLVQAYMKGLFDIMPPAVIDHDHTAPGDGGLLSAAIIDTYLILLEQAAAPPNPPANTVRLYAREDAGVTKLYYLQDDGTEIQLAAPAPPAKGAEVLRVAPQPINTGAWTTIIFDTEDLDQDNYWNPANPTRFTIPSDGWYTISYYTYWQWNLLGSRYNLLLHNGAATIALLSQPAASAGEAAQVNTTIKYLTAGDILECNVHQTSGIQLTINAHARLCRLP